MNVKIRPALLFDAPTIQSFQIKMAKETENMDLVPSVVELGVQAVFDNPERGKYFVCEYDSKVIGCLLLIPEWSDWRNGFVFWIHSVYVEEKFRGQKIFSKMYVYLKEFVQKENARGLRLYVDKTNAHAQKVYSSLGMNADHYALYEWMA